MLWGSSQFPRHFKLHGVTLELSPLQQFFSVLMHKREIEQAQGQISAEEFAKTYKQITWANPEESDSRSNIPPCASV